MNFFGHLVAASWLRPDADFALGAMLPDFASMCGLRLREEELAEKRELASLCEGVEFHHRTDRIFHRLAGFRELERWSLAHLQTLGLRRGPARGVAHIGVELCLDGALLGDPQGDALYLQAIEAGAARDWDALDMAPMQRLFTRLSSIGLPDHYRDSEEVAKRLVYIFASRPRLAFLDEEAEALAGWLAPVHERVEHEASGIEAALKRELVS